MSLLLLALLSSLPSTISSPLADALPSPVPQGVTAKIAPPGGIPTGCSLNWNGEPFGIAAVNITTGVRVVATAAAYDHLPDLSDSGFDSMKIAAVMGETTVSGEDNNPKPTPKPVLSYPVPEAEGKEEEEEEEPEPMITPEAKMMYAAPNSASDPAPPPPVPFAEMDMSAAAANPDTTLTVRSTRTRTRTVTVKAVKTLKSPGGAAPPDMTPPPSRPKPPSMAQGAPEPVAVNAMYVGIVSQIADGQIQAPETHAPVETTAVPVDGSEMMPTGVQTGRPPAESRVTQIGDGQLQVPPAPERRRKNKRAVQGMMDIPVSCGKGDVLSMTLQGGVLKDARGWTGYIADNRQFQ